MSHILQLGMLKAYNVEPDKAALACVNERVNRFPCSSKATFSLNEKQNLGLKPHMLKGLVLLGGWYISKTCMIYRTTASCVCCTFGGWW